MSETSTGSVGKQLKVGVLVVVLLLLALLPILQMYGLISDYILHIGGVILVWSLLATSLNLLVGYTGPESFAHGALFGMGGYTTAILSTQFGIPLQAAVLAGAILAVAAAMFIALPSLRLAGTYFAIITLAFQVIYQDTVLVLGDLTGGLNGISDIPTFAGFGLRPAYVDYYVILGVVAASIFVLHRIVHSGLGDTFVMIRQDEEFAAHLGFSTMRYKMLAFGISAFFTGLAGGLFAQHNAFVGPTLSNIFISFQIFVFVIIGGAGYFWGPIVATAALTALQEVASLSGVYSRLFTALLLLVVIIAAPGGIASIDYSRLYRRLTSKEDGEPTPSAGGD